MVGFWAGLTVTGCTKLSAQFYRVLAKNAVSPWCDSVREALTTYGYPELWPDGPLNGHLTFKENFKAKVWEQEQAAIYNRIMEGDGHASFYCQLVDPPQRLVTPWYMNAIDLKRIKTMCRFRLRSTNLEVVRGAWVGTPRNERVCRSCGILDDEVHFLMECRPLEHLRVKLLPAALLRSRSAASAIELLRSDNSSIVNNLCLFIERGFKLCDIVGQGE